MISDDTILNGLNGTKINVIEWAESMLNKEGFFRFNKASGATLLSNCFATFIYELFGETEFLAGAVRDRLKKYILSCQREETGLFIDPLLRKEDLIRPHSHSWDYVTMQSTMFSINALDALGEKPKYRSRFLDKYKDIDFLIKWLEERNWKNPWLESNNIMFIGCCLLYEYIETKDSSILEAIHELLNWHDKTQDPATGFWGTDRGASLHNGMAGAFHIYLIYHYLKRPIQYEEKIIDSVLSLQHKDGLFVAEGGGGACEDLDAIDILIKLTKLTDYRREDIKAAMISAFWGLVLTQNKDGGFSWRNVPSIFKIHKLFQFKFNPQIVRGFLQNMKCFVMNPGHFLTIYHYSNWSNMPHRVFESDAWSCWFRSLAILLIVSTYREEFGLNINCKFRMLPGLGWHIINDKVLSG